MAHLPLSGRRINNILLITSIVMLVALLVSACGGDPQTQQKAGASKTSLDKAIAYAQSIGVPKTMLTPIIQQESQINNTNAPITLFNGQPASDYYANLTQGYQVLTVQVQGLE